MQPPVIPSFPLVPSFLCTVFSLIYTLGTVALMSCRLVSQAVDARSPILAFTVKPIARVCVRADLAADLLCLVRRSGLALNAKSCNKRDPW